MYAVRTSVRYPNTTRGVFEDVKVRRAFRDGIAAASRDYFSVAWWVAVFPGTAIALTVLSVTVLGRHLQQRAEGRLA